MNNPLRYGALLAVLLLLSCAELTAKSTTATSSGDWGAVTWSSGTPVAGDDVAINAGVTVTVSSAVGYFATFTNNGALVFTNWDTSLSATTITLSATGSNTVPPAFTDAQMSNRVYFICSNLTLASGGSINVDAKGWAGGRPALSHTNGYGPGFGIGGDSNNEGDGAGYGGIGGSDESVAGAGVTYGNKAQPIDPGSGGGAGTNVLAVGGDGGGAVRIQADGGTVTINGTISANGGKGANAGANPNPGGGSGGGIYISCSKFYATNGTISVRGGNALGWGGGGGAGRIAIVCDPIAQAAVPQPTVTLQCDGGTKANALFSKGGIGTVYAAAGGALPQLWTNDVSVSGFTNYAPSVLTVSNAQVIFEERAAFRVTNDFNVVGGALLKMVDPDMTVGGSVLFNGATGYLYRATNNLTVRPSVTVGGGLTLSSNASLYVYAGTTNTGTGTNYDTIVSVTGSVTVVSNSWIYPTSDTTNGGAVYFKMGGLSVVDTNSGFNADGRGYRGGPVDFSANAYGPGAGSTNGSGSPRFASSAGYGGAGGRGYNGGTGRPGGPTYGSASAPFLAGSGGGSASNGASTAVGGSGGGVIWIDTSPAGYVTLNGALTANGVTPPGDSPGGGSGGSIYIQCKGFSGTTGSLSAKGGNGASYAGGAGGGRIAIICDPVTQQGLPRPSVTLNCSPGTGWDNGIPPEVGTIYVTEGKVLPELWPGGGNLSGFTNYAPSSLTVSNAQVIFQTNAVVTVTGDASVISGGRLIVSEGVPIAVTGNVSVTGGGRLDLYNPNWSVGGSMLINSSTGYVYRTTNLAVRPSVTVGGGLTLSSNASLYVYAGTTNAGGSDFDVSVTVGGTLLLNSNCWIYPTSDRTNGGSIKFSAHNVNISATNSGFLANGLGYGGGPLDGSTNGYGPGGGVATNITIAGGGGYGGVGGKGAWGGAGGNTYGSSNAPVLPGSGGGGCNFSTPAVGGAGGGLIWVEAQSAMNVNGLMAADAGVTPGGYGPGGGSGGGIYVRCKYLSGATSGVLSANGGAATGWGGPGGGGRIAVWAITTNNWLGITSATGALAANYSGGRTDATNGTVFWGLLREKGTIFVVH